MVQAEGNRKMRIKRRPQWCTSFSGGEFCVFVCACTSNIKSKIERNEEVSAQLLQSNNMALFAKQVTI